MELLDDLPRRGRGIGGVGQGELELHLARDLASLSTGGQGIPSRLLGPCKSMRVAIRERGGRKRGAYLLSLQAVRKDRVKSNIDLPEIVLHALGNDRPSPFEWMRVVGATHLAKPILVPADTLQEQALRAVDGQIKSHVPLGIQGLEDGVGDGSGIVQSQDQVLRRGVSGLCTAESLDHVPGRFFHCGPWLRGAWPAWSLVVSRRTAEATRARGGMVTRMTSVFRVR